MDREGAIRVLGRHDLGRPGVGADQDDLALAEPSRGLHADARLAGPVGGVVLHPEPAVPGADQDDVSLADLDALGLEAVSRSRAVMTSPAFIRSTPRDAATSTSTPRVKNTPTFSMPSFSRP